MQPYKRRIYLINPPFQLKVSAYICILVFISSLIYPFVIYDLIVKFGAKVENAQKLNQLKSDLITALTLWEIGFMVIIFIVVIFISHKIAGPMYKLKQHLTTIKNGEPYGNISFRSGDYFADIADDLNQALNRVKFEYSEDMEALDEIDAYLNNLKNVLPDDKKLVVNEISKKLNEIQDRYEQT